MPPPPASAIASAGDAAAADIPDLRGVEAVPRRKVTVRAYVAT